MDWVIEDSVAVISVSDKWVGSGLKKSVYRRTAVNSAATYVDQDDSVDEVTGLRNLLIKVQLQNRTDYPTVL